MLGQRRFVLFKNDRHQDDIDEHEGEETTVDKKSQVGFLIQFQLERIEDRFGGMPGWHWDPNGNLAIEGQAKQGGKKNGRVDDEADGHRCHLCFLVFSWSFKSYHHADVQEEADEVSDPGSHTHPRLINF